jgi:hypothetical protein
VPRYFFDVITNGDRIVDPLGLELPDREAARVEAIRAAVEMIANNALENAVDAQFEVTDENGTIILTLPFAAARTN